MYDSTYQSRWAVPQRFKVETCKDCGVSIILPIGEAWNHQCSAEPKHQLIWLSTERAGCTGCGWERQRFSRAVVGEPVRQYSSYEIRRMWQAKHQQEPSSH